VSEVVDPEIPVLTIADLGVLRGVAVVDGRVEVTITPTYSGCPAMNMIALEIELAVERAGLPSPTIRTVLHPAWTTDWMTEDGRRKLREYGVAPPSPGSGRRRSLDRTSSRVRAADRRTRNGWRSSARPRAKRSGGAGTCREPFDYFKCH
jgi:ring-1,2-phenylacetyl-CoA epoxidase subunit PaaD